VDPYSTRTQSCCAAWGRSDLDELYYESDKSELAIYDWDAVGEGKEADGLQNPVCGTHIEVHSVLQSAWWRRVDWTGKADVWDEYHQLQQNGADKSEWSVEVSNGGRWEIRRVYWCYADAPDNADSGAPDA